MSNLLIRNFIDESRRPLFIGDQHETWPVTMHVRDGKLALGAVKDTVPMHAQLVINRMGATSIQSLFELTSRVSGLIIAHEPDNDFEVETENDFGILKLDETQLLFGIIATDKQIEFSLGYDSMRTVIEGLGNIADAGYRDYVDGIDRELDQMLGRE